MGGSERWEPGTVIKLDGKAAIRREKGACKVGV